MESYTPKYGIIDYKQYDDLLPTKPWLGHGVCTYQKEQEIKAYELRMKNMATAEGVWFINAYEIADSMSVYFDNGQTIIRPECKTRYFIDNFLNLWTQRVDSCPNHYVDHMRNTRSMVTQQTHSKSTAKPLCDLLISKIKHDWKLPNDLTRIYVIHEYVRMHNEIESLKHGIKKLLEPPLVIKKPIDDEIAELQERIMVLYNEKDKN